MSHHIVEARNLHYVYPDGTAGLRGVSFRITHGESVAVVGGNGAGKSTLLLQINGCLFATRGEIRVGDYTVGPGTLNAVRRSVGMVFQNSEDQLFMPTVLDDVAFGPLNMGMRNEEAVRVAMQALKTVGAAHLKDRLSYHLSQGEKKAVAIATVLSMSPDILIMDEPTAGLDPMSRRRLIEMLKSFKHTKIIATHDLDMAADVCDRVIVMHEGRVMADGPAMEILADEALLAASHLEKPISMQKCPACKKRKKRKD